MEHIIYMTRDTQYVLTTDSAASRYGIPALRIEGKGAEHLPDYGPGDLIPVGGQAIYAAALVALCAMAKGRTPEEEKAAAAFCQQWPEGMQVISGRADANEDEESQDAE